MSRLHGKRRISRVAPAVLVVAAAVFFGSGAGTADAAGALPAETVSTPASVPGWVPFASGGLLIGGGIVMRRALADRGSEKP